jgi:MFS family permease
LTLATFPAMSSVFGVGLICVLFSVGAIYPLVMSQARAIVPARRLGLAFSLLDSLVFLGVALASGSFGWIAREAADCACDARTVLRIAVCRHCIFR